MKLFNNWGSVAHTQRPAACPRDPEVTAGSRGQAAGRWVVFLRFLIVGVLNTAFNYSVFFICFSEVGLNYLTAGMIGFFSGALSGYVLNRLWTFKSDVPFTSGMAKYFLVQCVCVVAHVLTQTSVVWILAIPKLYSQFFGIVVTTFLNFTLISKWVYRKS